MKQAATILVSVSLALASIAGAQTARTDLFDLKKSQQELEIMRGILSTTVSFVVRELRARVDGKRPEEEWLRGSSWGTGNVSAFYLYGQGAVFLVPSSTLSSLWGERFKFELGHGEVLSSGFGKIVEAERALASAKGVIGGVPGGVVGGVGSGRAAAAPKPDPAARQDEIRKRLEELQAKAKEQSADAEKRRAKLDEYLGEIRGYLIEALANHGDSLTHVKPAEYVTIVLSTDDGGEILAPRIAAGRLRREMISVPKSVIGDYKAGRLNLEAFKQKVLVYGN